jgi:2-hydroxychromene-2-carboxylate isomerase
VTRVTAVFRPRIYFSFRSPYSWLAVHDLVTKHADVAAGLDWRPFWEPDERSLRLLEDAGGRFIYSPMSREKHLYMLGDVRRLAMQRNLSMTWPVDRAPWWEASHLAYLVAAEEGCGPQFIERVYRARWQEASDISDPTVIAELAADSGVSCPKTAANAGDDDVLRGRGVDALLAVYQDGVFGVPFFVNRREKFWGVDRLDAFMRSLAAAPERYDQRDRSETVLSGGSTTSDGGHAGGCG